MDKIKNAPMAKNWMRGDLVRCVDSSGPNMTSFAVGEHYRVVGRGKGSVLISISDTSPRPKRITNKTADRCFEFARPRDLDKPGDALAIGNRIHKELDRTLHDWPLHAKVVQGVELGSQGRLGRIVARQPNWVTVHWDGGGETMFDPRRKDLNIRLLSPNINRQTAFYASIYLNPEIAQRWIPDGRPDNEAFDPGRSILELIAEWRKGCGNTQLTNGSPAECLACTEALIAAIELRATWETQWKE